MTRCLPYLPTYLDIMGMKIKGLFFWYNPNPATSAVQFFFSPNCDTSHGSGTAHGNGNKAIRAQLRERLVTPYSVLRTRLGNFLLAILVQSPHGLYRFKAEMLVSLALFALQPQTSEQQSCLGFQSFTAAPLVRLLVVEFRLFALTGWPWTWEGFGLSRTGRKFLKGFAGGGRWKRVRADCHLLPGCRLDGPDFHHVCVLNRQIGMHSTTCLACVHVVKGRGMAPSMQ
ncbi:hypothetical protein B0T26DRAFT_270465 [Lasiosphaeria miniovina]|uniref:Uncharacterized protein n=1 Tax=Lasiosphaeria miniovina TaxID=1954250 RepID=A0AA40AJE1_9PEZI|nr:uncharacterized protein B0T26DRAFT_270465 [Lasiosphaeria miniovina]KAK0716927.1 hypothetical protein B0T26DRAFT_270465 [Lasiosphaeria miniovina]